MTKKQLIEEVEKCKRNMDESVAILTNTNSIKTAKYVAYGCMASIENRIEILWNCADIVNDMISLKTIREIKSMLKEIK